MVTLFNYPIVPRMTTNVDRSPEAFGLTCVTRPEGRFRTARVTSQAFQRQTFFVQCLGPFDIFLRFVPFCNRGATLLYLRFLTFGGSRLVFLNPTTDLEKKHKTATYRMDNSDGLEVHNENHAKKRRIFANKVFGTEPRHSQKKSQKCAISIVARVDFLFSLSSQHQRSLK